MSLMHWISTHIAPADCERNSATTRPQRVFASIGIVFVAMLMQGCASLNSGSSSAKSNFDPKKDPAPGFLISLDAFKVPPKALPNASTLPNAAKEVALPKSLGGSPAVFIPRVLLYASPSTQSYLEGGGVNASYRIEAWESVLSKYKIPYQQINRPAQIDNALGGVLILPSSVALSSREKQAIVDFRSKGGSVLATWASGIRDEKGAWQGFDFMSQALDTVVVGTTASEKDDNFLMVQGDSPVNQTLPAGNRIWTERAVEWFPLRMTVKRPALHIMDWSRTFHDQRTTAVAHFDERVYDNGTSSRIVALGVAERLWLSADPRFIEAFAHNSINWLMRLPSANTAAWPGQYQSALLFALDCAETILDSDLVTLKHLEVAGVKATVYLLGDNAKGSAAKLSAVVKAGHELAFKGDKFTPFRGQASDTQNQRIDGGLAKIKDAGLILNERPSFYAPTESYDKTTEAIVQQRGFGSYIATQEASEARVPIVIASELSKAPSTKSVVVFPRSQRGPEDATEEGDVDDGLKSFYAEFSLSVQMRGLAVVRMPNQGLLTVESMQEVADEFKRYQGKVWMATASEIAEWWLAKESVIAKVVGTSLLPILSVSVTGNKPETTGVTALVNLPIVKGTMQLFRDGKQDEQVRIFRVDDFRMGVQFPELASGVHHWQIKFM